MRAVCYTGGIRIQRGKQRIEIYLSGPDFWTSLMSHVRRHVM
jgi:hypothetical protein